VREFGDIEETHLPGVGVRYDFVTEQGDRLGLVVLESGERDLLICDEEDPDAARTLRLAERDLVRLGEILGMSVNRTDL
jgi:TrkA domain protein